MRHWWNNRTNPLSIALPVIIAIIVFVIIVKAISGGSAAKTTEKNEASGASFVTVLPKKDAKVDIYMSSDSKNAITNESKLFPSDKMVRVESGDADVSLQGSTTGLSLEIRSELAYLGKTDGKEGFELNNGSVWIDTPNGDTTMKLKYFTVTFNPGTVAIAVQNTVASNLYVLKGKADIQTEAASANLESNQMISLLTSEAKLPSLGEKIGPLEDMIKQSSLYIKKGGDAILAQSGVSDTGSGNLQATASGSTTATASQNSGNISITYPEDEMSVDTENITIEGKILNPSVKKIAFGKRDAQILPDGTFQLKNYLLTDAVNDINYRVYDETGTQIMKDVITVNLNTKKATVKKPDVVNFPISSKDFKVTFPTDNPYKTTENAVKIRGSFAADIVKYIKVNTYQLQQFKQFGTSWTYNASIENGNMEEGVNEYLITYYGPNDEVLATSKVYIVKETAPAATSDTTSAPTTTETTVTPKPATNTGTGTATPSL